MTLAPDWAARARAVLPAGGFGNFDPSLFLTHGHGSRVWDDQGRDYVDYLIGSGPMLLGHTDPEVIEAVTAQLPRGLTFFANNPLGVELAEQICQDMACADQVRFLASGSEADMYAIRLARAFTGRDLVLKFEGGYHGMSAEAQISLAPSRLVNFPQGVPDSAGIPESVPEAMLIAPFNDAEFLAGLMDEYGPRIACVIVEPLQRIIPPAPGFLAALRTACDRHGAVLIFDEIVTGYRLAYGGAQAAYGVTPDLCTLGKIIGGGFPLAAVAGRRDIMDHLDKSRVETDRWLMMIGTLSGNPVAAAAGLKTLEILRRPGAYDRLHANGARVMAMAARHLDAHGIPHRIVGHPGLFDILFIDRDVRDYRDVVAADTARYARFNAALRSHGILKPPGKVYPSLVLTEDDFARTDMALAAAALAAV